MEEERGEKEEKVSARVCVGYFPENVRTRHSHLHLRQRARASTLRGLPGFPPPHTTQIKRACRGMKINFR